MFTEFWFGNQQEQQAIQTVQSLRSLDTLKHRQEVQLNRAEAISRRVFLRRVATLGGTSLLVAAGVGLPKLGHIDSAADSLRVEQPFRGSHYQNWQRFFGRDLPKDTVVAIANDLIHASEYAGFAEAGELLRTAATDFRAITQFTPGLTEPVRLQLIPLVQQARAEAMFQNEADFDDEGIPVRITEKSTGRAIDARFADSKGNKVKIFLEQTMAFGSNAVKALLITKEISHLAYMPEMRQLIFEEFSSRYDINSTSSLAVPDLLFTNAQLLDVNKQTPDMGYFFRNSLVLIDWAAYWHITPALGRMLRQGVLGREDKQALGGNISAFNLAQQRGLIAEQKPGVYQWQEEITPFSQQWQDVMKNTRDVPQLLAQTNS